MDQRSHYRIWEVLNLIHKIYPRLSATTLMYVIDSLGIVPYSVGCDRLYSRQQVDRILEAIKELPPEQLIYIP